MTEGIDENWQTVQRSLPFKIVDWTIFILGVPAIVFLLTLMSADSEKPKAIVFVCGILMFGMCWHHMLRPVERWSETHILSRRFSGWFAWHQWIDLCEIREHRKTGKTLIFKRTGRVEIVPLDRWACHGLKPDDYHRIVRLAERKLKENARTARS
ncbi:MAG: hypothetical protein AAGA94_00685 [Pseudomonadota bacterium]